MGFELVRLADSGPYSADYLGGKGFGLWKMAQAGYPVPPAIIIPTEVCRAYMQDPDKVEQWLKDEALFAVHKYLSEEFGHMPLVSVRSGAKQSMPGMMDTILNVGIGNDNWKFWHDKLGSVCAGNCLTRLQEMYASVVGHGLPSDPEVQLFNSILAVFKSWNNERAVTYRNMHGIPHDGGTAVVIQAMVFGNLNAQSGTGVLFTRDPANGDFKLTGNWLPKAQGEDVVAGTVTPMPLVALHDWNPKVFDELKTMVTKLETENKDVQDVEFTVQDGKLYLLQTRTAKRTAMAAVQIAVDMEREGLITRKEALLRVTAKQILSASRPAINPAWLADNPAMASGCGASVGVVVGKAVFTSKDAVAATEPVILIREETDPNDIGGMAAAVGILTQKGGSTSHAAVTARALDKVAVVGCSAMMISGGKAVISTTKGLKTITKGTTIALDGASGSIWVDTTPEMIGGAVGPVREFLSLLGKEYGYYEVATKASNLCNPERVLVPAYAMGVAEFEAEVAKIATVAKDLIIDLREPVVDPISVPLAFLWGPPASRVHDYQAVLCNLKLEGVRLIVSHPDLVLESFGYTVIPVVDSWADLEAASGLVIADHEAMAKIKAKVPVILKQKEAKGKSVQSLNCVAEVDHGDMGKAQFAMVPMLAALSLLGV